MKNTITTVEDDPFFSSSIRLLLVEDNAVNQKVAVSLLKKIGLPEPDIAFDGKEAVTISQNKDYDLILMDCQMPVMSGYEATGLIRQREQTHHQHRIPIIAMTANAMQGDREKCLAAGMDDYLSKPINTESLKAMLIKWLIQDDALEPSNSLTDHDENSHQDATVSDEQTIIDDAVFNTLKDIMGDEFPMLLETFLEDTPSLFSDLQKAAKSADIEVVVRAAHTLKSSGSNLGATLLADTALEIESHGKQGDLQKAVQAIPRLEGALNQTMMMIRSKADTI